MMTLERTTRSPDETMQLAQQIAGRLRGGEIIALRGSLGAGKTCFVRGLARGLSIPSEHVSSPTFIICQEYAPTNRTPASSSAMTLLHIDAYRLSGPDELESIGWDDLVRAERVIIAIEWPGRIDEAIPPERRIDIALGPDAASANARSVTITVPPPLRYAIERLP